MNRSEAVEAWLAWRDGESLSSDRQRDLIATLEADPELRRSLQDEEAIDGLLRAHAGVSRGEAVVASVRVMIAATVDAPVFAERVRRRLQRPSSRRRVIRTSWWQRSALAAALIAVCGLAALLAWALQRSPRAESGDATLPVLACLDAGASARHGADAIPAGARLRDGDAVDSGSGHAVLTWDDGTRVELMPRSSVVLGSTAPGKSLSLTSGRIAAHAAHQPEGAPFLLRTPQAAVTVIGTTFRLGTLGGETRLDVAEGVVRLAAGDGEITVRSGENGIADAKGARVGPPVRFEWHPEDGTALLKRGVLVDGPDGRRCLKAEPPQPGEVSRVVSVLFQPGHDLFRIAPETEIECSVWIGRGASWAGVLLSDFTDQRFSQFGLAADQRGAWMRLRIHLADLQRAEGELLRAGDAVQCLLVQALPAEQSEVYVDEVRVTGP